MELRSFEDIRSLAESLETRPRMAVAAAADPHTLEAVVFAEQAGVIEPVLLGDAEGIRRILKDLAKDPDDYETYDEPDALEAASKAVKLVKDGKADCILKGKLDTAVLLKAVVNKENGISTGRLMSHFTIFEVPAHDRLIAAVDGGMVAYPDLMQKKAIIENTVAAMRALGVDTPKVGVLACVEKINPKMPETLDGAALKEMNERGEIRNCIVEGPISYDCALRKDIADLKGFKSPCAGCCDILVAPNIQAGNIMGKMFTISAGGKMAGIILGAGCPIAMVSRGSDADEKYTSIVLAALVAKGLKTLEE
jgi:phosphate butyryltransferase